MKWRTFYVDDKINGDGMIPALQVAIPSEINADSALEAAQGAAIGHPFDGIRKFVCIPVDQYHEVTLMKSSHYEEVDND